jgi:MoaD family protein
MKVRYFALLREATGKREEIWTRPAPDVRTLIRDLVALYGEPFAKWVMVGDQLAPFVAVLLDGKDIRDRDGLDRSLEGVAEVHIFPPLAGG